jgi:hypothetical protein
VPVGLGSATARAATIYSTSTLTAAGVSPVVVGLTDGVLRMFRMKKVMTAVGAAILVLGAGVLALGTGVWSEGAARATAPAADDPPAEPEGAEDFKRLDRKLADLEKQRKEIDRAVAEVAVERARLEEALREKKAAAALGTDLVLVVRPAGDKKSAYTYTLREVVAGKLGEMSCSELAVVAVYLARAHQDPKGPKGLRLEIYGAGDAAHRVRVFAACASAGYKKVALTELVAIQISTPPKRVITPGMMNVHQIERSEIDLAPYAEPKKP